MSYDVDYPNAEYHEILPNLFLGGHIWKEGFKHRNGRHSTVSEDDTWDYVVSAYIEPEYENSLPTCDNRMVIFRDTEKGLDDRTWKRIHSAVGEVLGRWNDGEKVLIRCQAGFNRSGLIAGLVLVNLGYEPSEAIKLLREKRSSYVLVNPVFEKYVLDYGKGE